MPNLPVPAHPFQSDAPSISLPQAVCRAEFTRPRQLPVVRCHATNLLPGDEVEWYFHGDSEDMLTDFDTSHSFTFQPFNRWRMLNLRIYRADRTRLDVRMAVRFNGQTVEYEKVELR